MSGIVSTVKDTFFGGAEKKAAKAQQKALEQSQEYIRENIAQARGDVMGIFPQARESARSGFQSALDVFAQSIPQQANLFQQGNVGAQQMLSQGLPQMQNAILGLPTNLSFAQPQQLQMPDFSYLQQQLPQLQQAQQPTQEQLTATQLIGGAPLLNNPFNTQFNFDKFGPMRNY